jgi:hypothetical protein
LVDEIAVAEMSCVAADGVEFDAGIALGRPYRYRTDAPHDLESDLRTQHLSLNPTRTSENAYGVAYEIEGPIRTPGGRVVRFVSIWQIDTGSHVPRLITMYPR